MRKLFFIMFAMCFSFISSLAQDVKEPEFIGDVCILNQDSSFVKLAKEICSIKAKTSPLSMVPLAGLASSVKSYMSVKGAESKVRVKKENQPLQFIVRCKDNSSSPDNLISIVQFEKKKKERRVLMGKTSLLGGSDFSGFESLPYEAEKYGESSYKITVSGLEPGEYGVMVSEQENAPGSYIAFRCIGID